MALASGEHGNSDPCLILTATVQVREDMCLTVRRDTDTRLRDYLEAFSRWMRARGVKKIVFVENSGYDLSSFMELASHVPEKTVEFLSFEAPPFDGDRGKGFGEMLCLEHCLAESRLLNTADRFAKVTGRYYLANIASFLTYLAETRDVDVVCNFHKNLTWADSRAFGGSTAFLKDVFHPMRDEIYDSRSSTFENVLARAVHRVMAAGGRWSPTPETLEVHGVSGSGGNTWTPGALKRLRQHLKHRLLLNLLAR